MNTIEEALKSLKNTDEEVVKADKENFKESLDKSYGNFKKFEYEVIGDTIGDNIDVDGESCDIEVRITNPTKKTIDLDQCFLDDPKYAEYVNPEEPDEGALDEYDKELLKINTVIVSCRVNGDNSEIEFEGGYEEPEYFYGDYGQSGQLSAGGSTVEDVDASGIGVYIDDSETIYSDEDGENLDIESVCKVLDCSKEEFDELINELEPVIEKEAKNYLKDYLKDYFMENQDKAMKYEPEPDYPDEY